MATTLLKETKDGKRYYEIRVSRGRDKSRLSCRWYVPDGWGKRAIERELAAVAADFERQVEAGEIVSRAEQREQAAQAALEAAKLRTVEQYIDGVFMPTKEIRLSDNAKANYQMMIDKHILPIIGNLHLSDVSPAMIQKMLVDFQKAGYAHATSIKLYNILNGVFQMAFLDDSISVNPMLKVNRPAPRKGEAPKEESDKAYTVKELAQILSCAAQEPLKWQAFIILAIDTGARRGELCGLQWADIDWASGSIAIRRNLQYTAQRGVYETSPKNGRARIVDVGPDTLSMIRQLREEQAASCISKWIFTQDETPAPMHPQSPTRYFKKFGERYNIPDFHPHKLRHSSASIAITNGADVVSVSERLGHSDTAVTLRMYAHANDESIRRAGQIVRDVLKAQNE